MGSWIVEFTVWTEAEVKKNCFPTLLITAPEWILTPSYDGVPVEVASLRKESLHQQSEEIQTFDEQPEIVGHDTVMEENHYCFTRHLHGGKKTQEEAH